MKHDCKEVAEALALADQMLDGELTAAAQARLEMLVCSSEDARSAYVKHLHLHGVLQESAFGDVEDLSDVLKLEPAGASSPRRVQSMPRWLPLAASLALMGLGWWLGRWQVPQPATHAELIEVKGAKWEGNRLPTEPGARIAAGRLKLAAGLATIEFDRGARVTMEGPAELEIVDAQKCYLHGGTLTAHVPPQAVGFVVDTKHAKLVDHGTDFGVSVGGEGAAQVRVFEGKVELEHHVSGRRLELLTQQGAQVGDGDFERSEREEDDTGALRRRHQVPEGTGVMMLSTAQGRGRAAYAWSPGTNLHFSKQLLILKHCERPGFRRKAWLGFDLGRLESKKVEKARLTLMFEATGWGYAALLPDAVFSVYGVTDDSLDDWRAEDLNWANAPANDVNGIGADLSKAVKLGSFSLPAGVLEGAFSLEGGALARFLNEDKNRFATLMVVRETTETGGGGVVHGFAGNEHPMLRPPTLYLEFEDGHSH